MLGLNEARHAVTRHGGKVGIDGFDGMADGDGLYIVHAMRVDPWSTPRQPGNGPASPPISAAMLGPVVSRPVGARPYPDSMTTDLNQAAALVALLRARQPRLTWNDIATEVMFSGDAVEACRGLLGDDGLVADPRVDAAINEARDDVLAWQRDGLHFVTVLDESYPDRLRDIRETPPFLFAAGALLPGDRGMSVVGSRKASERGHQIARAAAELLVAKGLTVIAGLAAGIDTTAHRAALDVGGRTVAFIGTGIRQYYPAENYALQDEIAERGLVLSQFWPDAPPTKQSFPIRNASMSGYGMGTIVVEAGETSGTRIQARLAVEHGRPVILTDMVANSTKWGAALVGRPGVHVAAGIGELDETIDRVLDEQAALGRALEQLGDIAPSAA